MKMLLNYELKLKQIAINGMGWFLFKIAWTWSNNYLTIELFEMMPKFKAESNPQIY